MYLLFRTHNKIAFATLKGLTAEMFLSDAFCSPNEWEYKKQKMEGGNYRDKFTWIGDDNSSINIGEVDMFLYLDKGFMFYVIR